MERCVVCRERSAGVGLLCTDCVSVIDVRDGLCPEQIGGADVSDTGAMLVDRWGRAHALTSRTLVGRAADLAIHCASVSKKHAIVEKTGAGWQVVDLDSRNGTQVNGAPVADGQTLVHGDRATFGTASLLFVIGADPAGADRPPAFGTRPLHAEVIASKEADTRSTDLPLRLVELPRGGGGLAQLNGEEVQLTALQLTLSRLLLERRREDAGEPSEVAGFVTSIELLSGLPWSTGTPDDVNLRQLVRRLRRRLSPLGLVIEGRHGMGYRLLNERADLA